MCNLVAKVREVPTLIPLVALIAAICVLSVACSGNKAVGDKVAASDVMPLAARVDRLDGEVAVDRPTDAQDTSQNQANADWGKASVNSPVSVGSRVYVKDNSHAAIAFTGRNYARLNPQTSLDVLSLSQRRTQLALRDGSGIFDVGALAPDELFEVATPHCAVDFQQPGLYQVGIDDGGNTLISVLSGIAQVVGLGGSGQITRGQLLTLGGEGSEAYISQLDSSVCGNIANDYYSYRYPKTYDGRYSDYQRFQDDHYYDDPYRRSASYQYIPDNAELAGLEDLDDYGDWEDVSGQGHCWSPRVSSDWAPYRDGSWYDDQPLGLTWVSNERWGWAPYHYGRWTHVNQRWYWVPGEVVSRPVYAPALVAFVPFTDEDRVGWVALGPGDPYVPRYYDRNYQPHYIGSTTRVTNVTTIVNYNIPGAVTVVRTTEFTQVITPRNAQIADQGWLARSRPVLDPYADPRLRELAPVTRTHWPRVRVDDRADQALNRAVITSRDPIVPEVVADIPTALKMKSVPEGEGKRKLQVNNTGQTVTAIRPNGLPVPSGVQGGQNQTMTAQSRQARIDALAAQAAKGDKSGKREMRQLMDQQRVQEKADRKTAQQATGTRQEQLQPQKQEQKAARKAAAQQQPAVQQQQQKQEQKAARKAAAQQQPPVQQQQQKQEQNAARKAAAQQQPPAQQQQQKQQQKAARKAAQPQQQLPAEQQQQKQQQKAERKAAQQPPSPQASPSKGENKAEKAKNKNKNGNPN